MKHFVLSSFIFATLFVNAQTNTFPTSGNVGIGTTTPSRTLDVAGDVTANNFYLKGAWNGAKISGNGETVDYLSSWYHSFYSVTNSVPTLFLNARSGNVGIGTATPGLKLVVQGLGGGNVDLAVNGRIVTGDASNSGGVWVAGPGNMFMGQVNSSAMGWYNNGAWRMIADNNGNVGIGTTTPTYKFHVAGGAIAMDADQPLRGGGRWLISGNDTQVTVGTTNPGIGLRFDAGSANSMVINGTNGNVGIGTTSPTQKLTVNGTIYGKEVKVDLSVPGPDYVFANNYQLLTLNELKTYIDQHKHLPEVPSSKEMEKNGIQLGEMNMLLLKKIEELTLHLIEQEKKIEFLNRKVKSLELSK